MSSVLHTAASGRAVARRRILLFAGWFMLNVTFGQAEVLPRGGTGWQKRTEGPVLRIHTCSDRGPFSANQTGESLFYCFWKLGNELTNSCVWETAISPLSSNDLKQFVART